MLMYNLVIATQIYTKNNRYMEIKQWETEKFVLDLATGEMMRSIDRTLIEAYNFEQAHKKLLDSGMTWLRLSGNWFSKEDEDDEKGDDEINLDSVFKSSRKAKVFNGFAETDFEAFEHDPTNFLNNLSLDNLFDWLNTLDKEQVHKAWTTALMSNLDKEVRIIEGFLKFKYDK